MPEKVTNVREESSVTESPPSVELSSLDPDPAVAEDLLSLRGFLERGDVDGAREFVNELTQRWPHSERVHHMARVLAPPVARVVPRSLNRSLQREYSWLREHARTYPGCWLAVYEDQLVAADPDLSIVLEKVRHGPGAEDSLIHFQPDPAK